MTSDEGYREVYFGPYCETCIYKDRDEKLLPCCDCLEEPLNLESHKPVKWEGKKGYEHWIFDPNYVTQCKP